MISRYWYLAAAIALSAVAAFAQSAPDTRPKSGTPENRPKPSTPNAIPAPSGAAAPGQLYKQSGPADAPIVMEVFTDYQCPDCADFYQDILPLLEKRYAGKIKLIHRDYPLVRHQYARLAARYANAAGLEGQYQPVVEQLFKTQKTWVEDGNIDAQVAAVVPAREMAKIRTLVKDEAKMDRMLDADVALGQNDVIRFTPTVVIVKNGDRHQIAPISDIGQLEAYLDGVVAKTL